MGLPEDQAQSVFDQLLAQTDTKTGQVNDELWELSRTIRTTPGLLEWLDAVPSAEGRVEDLRAEFPGFMQDLDEFLGAARAPGSWTSTPTTPPGSRRRTSSSTSCACWPTASRRRRRLPTSCAPSRPRSSDACWTPSPTSTATSSRRSSGWRARTPRSTTSTLPRPPGSPSPCGVPCAHWARGSWSTAR